MTRELRAIREETFSRAFDHCMSDVNFVPKLTGPVLNDGINKYFFIFIMWLLWPHFGTLIVTPYMKSKPVRT
jgi:hypothetical protein